MAGVAFGLDRVVPTGAALQAALDLAEPIGRNAPRSVQASKPVTLAVDNGTIRA